MEEEGFEFPWDPEENYFVSGSNHAGEIKGLALSGRNVGVAAQHVNADAEAELCALAGSFTKVFVDSGAFSEVGFGPSGPFIKAPISDEEWRERLGLYVRLAAALGPLVYVVAPDMVAFQAETLDRLRRWLPQLQRVMELGGHIIVPVQKGALSMTEFRHQATAILGTHAVVWGIPMKKDATSLEDLGSFVDDLFLEFPFEETRIHLLGLGLLSPRYPDALETIIEHSPMTTVFCDSVRITAMVGRGEPRKDGTCKPRKLTIATDKVKATGRYHTATGWKAAALWQVMMDETTEDMELARRCGWYDGELESAPREPLERGCLFYRTKDE